MRPNRCKRFSFWLAQASSYRVRGFPEDTNRQKSSAVLIAQQKSSKCRPLPHTEHCADMISSGRQVGNFFISLSRKIQQIIPSTYRYFPR